MSKPILIRDILKCPVPAICDPERASIAFFVKDGTSSEVQLPVVLSHRDKFVLFLLLRNSASRIAAMRKYMTANQIQADVIDAIFNCITASFDTRPGWISVRATGGIDVDQFCAIESPIQELEPELRKIISFTASFEEIKPSQGSIGFPVSFVDESTLTDMHLESLNAGSLPLPYKLRRLIPFIEK